jgi:hypothetical protein
MKVIWLKPHHKFAYFAGNVCDLEQTKAKELIESGFVKIHIEETPEPNDTEKEEGKETPEPKAKETATAKTTKKAETATKK